MIQTIKCGTLRAPGSASSRPTWPESPHEPQGDLPVQDHNAAAPDISPPDKSADHVFATPVGLDCADVGLERQVQDVIRRLQHDFPEIDRGTIRTLLHEALGRTLHARVRQFRSLLAERTVRDQLQCCSASEPRQRGAVTELGTAE